MTVLDRKDPRVAMGVPLYRVGPPFTLRAATRESPDEGGTLDLGIIGTLPDGRQVVVGELWAMGPAGGERVSFDPCQVVRTLGIGATAGQFYDLSMERAEAEARFPVRVKVEDHPCRRRIPGTHPGECRCKATDVDRRRSQGGAK